MSVSMVACSCCAKQFPINLAEYDDHENPICPECAEKKREREKDENESK